MFKSKLTKDRKLTEVRHRGRPRKIRTPEELKKLEEQKKNKLTLEQRQALKLKAQKEKEARRIANGNEEPKNKDRFYCTNKDLRVELMNWKKSAEKVEDRVISENLGKMMMELSSRILNHSSFRNYPLELKQDMQSNFYYKIIKGLKNYNFEFNNPFAFFSQVCFNAYLNVLTKHYKHLNIKKDLMKKLSQELETYNGIDSRSALNKAIKCYLGNDIDLD